MKKDFGCYNLFFSKHLRWAWSKVLPLSFQPNILSRRYVPPDQVKGPTYTKGSASTPIQGSIPEGKPLRTLLGDPVSSLSADASSSSQVTLRSALHDYFGIWETGVSVS